MTTSKTYPEEYQIFADIAKNIHTIDSIELLERGLENAEIENLIVPTQEGMDMFNSILEAPPKPLPECFARLKK